MPVDAKITLQEVIRTWPPGDANQALQRSIGGLRFLGPRATPEWRLLVELYLKTLQDYLKDNQAAARDPMLGKHSSPILKRVKTDAVEQLNALDIQRDAVWNSMTPTHLPQLGDVTAGKPVAGQ